MIVRFKFKLAVEIRRGQPRPCERHHADEAPAELPSCTEATLDLARCGWDHDQRSPAVAAKFGFAAPVTARCGDAQPPGAPAPPPGQQPDTTGHGA